MDALSTPSSALGMGVSLSAAPREILFFRPSFSPSTAPPPPARPHRLSSGRNSHLSPSITTSCADRSLLPLPSPSDPFCRSRRQRPVPILHRKASTGYAVALLDASRCEGDVAAMERDVRRFSWAVHAVLADPHAAEGRKVEAVRRTLESGGFGRHLVMLVRMLVGKGKVGLLWDVMKEFERIYDQLTGTQAVLVSSERKMRMEQLASIAEGVRRASGASKVRVTHAYA